MSDSSLHNIRVLDFIGGLGPYTAKLYAGLGADVIHCADSLGERLRAGGARAGVVNDAQGAMEDRHLVERNFWISLDHPVVDPTRYRSAPIVFSKSPIEMRTDAPLRGQHTRGVLSRILGYSEKEIDRLSREDILT